MDKVPKRLLDLGKEEFKAFLDSFDHVFSDCDGVIWLNNSAFPQVGEFFKLMKKHGKTVNFVSNNSIRSKENYVELFKLANIDNGYEHLITPSIAIAEYLKESNIDKHVYCVACDQTVRTMQSYGLKCKTGPDVPPLTYQEHLKGLQKDPEIGAVVFDCDFRVNLAKLYKAVTYLKDPEVKFLHGATDRQVFYKEGCSIFGVSVFTDIASVESNREPITLSKPSREFGEFVMKRVGVTDPKRVLFIGDMIEQDVGLGKATGFQTLLLLTNITTDVMYAHETIQPDYFADSLGSIVPIL